jgi:phospholipid/cholesterol/gamma-HCH transport system ATP-binding protein
MESIQQIAGTQPTLPKNKNDILSISHLKKTFDKKEVLKDISLQLTKGENLVVLGKSGSGKSVLIKCLVGLIKMDEGKVSLFGDDLSKLGSDQLNDVRKRIGFLFQSGALYDSMTVEENLLFPLRNNRVLSKSDKEKLLIESLSDVGLADTRKMMPSELSGGMRKRLGLARTLILKPEIMLYDEPTTGLDPITAKEISELILEVQRKYQTSSIIITHDMKCASITANRMIILDDGLIVMEGSYEELKDCKKDPIQLFFN